MADVKAKLAEALGRAFALGQTYWQQADSESFTQNAKSEVTYQKFRDLMAETLAANVPAGWKLVPVEPTTGMLVAGNHCQPGDYSAKLVWQSMLEAADRSAELSYLRPLPQDVATPPAPAPESGNV